MDRVGGPPYREGLLAAGRGGPRLRGAHRIRKQTAVTRLRWFLNPLLQGKWWPVKYIFREGHGRSKPVLQTLGHAHDYPTAETYDGGNVVAGRAVPPRWPKPEGLLCRAVARLRTRHRAAVDSHLLGDTPLKVALLVAK